MTLSLSTELEAIASDFKSRNADVPVNEIIETSMLLAALGKLAQRMELELSIFRDMEAGAQARRSMELAATEQLEDMIADTKGKILRPNFSKGERS